MLAFISSLTIYSCDSKEESRAKSVEKSTLNSSKLEDGESKESAVTEGPIKASKQANRETDTKYRGMKWVTENTISPIDPKCFDSLEFLKEGQIYVYDCEMDWHFLGDYYVKNDTIKIEIVEAQFEVENTDGYQPSSIWSLKEKDKKLAVVSIRLMRNSKWEEIATEELKKKLNFKQVK